MVYLPGSVDVVFVPIDGDLLASYAYVLGIRHNHIHIIFSGFEPRQSKISTSHLIGDNTLLYKCPKPTFALHKATKLLLSLTYLNTLFGGIHDYQTFIWPIAYARN